MGRIRTIKPEFPQSESMGRVSRDARLCFVMLWTIADDSGRLRGASRMLASLLFPYDDDAPRLMEAWLCELEHEGCIHRYRTDGGHYIEIAKWLSHQKIDKPSESRLPKFDEDSRGFANVRESSATDLGSRTVDLGPRKKPSVSTRGARLPQDWTPSESGFSFASQQGLTNGRAALEAEKFRDYWTAATGQHASKADWQAAWRTWVRKAVEMAGNTYPKAQGEPTWRTEQRERAEAFAGPAAAKRTTKIQETVDVTAKRLD